MNKKKILIALLSLMLSICMVFGLAACNQHTHAFDTVKYDGTNHWNECSCGEKEMATAHVFDEGTITTAPTKNADGVKTFACECGYTKTEVVISEYKAFAGLGASFAEIEEGEGITLTIKGEDVKFENYKLGNLDLVSNINGVADGEIYFGIDVEGNPELKGHAEVDMEVFQADALVATGKIDATFMLEGENLLLAYSMIEEYEGALEGEDENIIERSLVINIPEYLGMFAQQIQESEFGAVIEMVSEIIAQNQEFISDKLLPVIDALWGQVDEAIEEAIMLNIQEVYTFEKANDKYTIKFDHDKFAQNVEAFFETQIKDLVDQKFGAGTFAGITEGTDEVLDITVAQIVGAIFTENFTVADLENFINSVAQNFEPTFELSKIFGFADTDLADVVNDPQYANMTIVDIIKYFVPEINGAPVNKQLLAGMVTGAINMVGEMTMYDMVMSLIAPEIDGPAGSVEQGPQLPTKAEVKETVGMILDVFKKVFGFEIVLNAESKLEKIELVLDVDARELNPEFEITEPVYNMMEAFTQCKITFTVTLGAFANALEFDYTAFAQSFATAE